MCSGDNIKLLHLLDLLIHALGILHGLANPFPTRVEQIEQRAVDEVRQHAHKNREVHDLRDQEFPINAEFCEEFHVVRRRRQFAAQLFSIEAKKLNS